MYQVRTSIRIGPDHKISGVAPPMVPAGEHEATIAVAAQPLKRFRLEALPLHDVRWDNSVSLRREGAFVAMKAPEPAVC